MNRKDLNRIAPYEGPYRDAAVEAMWGTLRNALLTNADAPQPVLPFDCAGFDAGTTYDEVVEWLDENHSMGARHVLLDDSRSHVVLLPELASHLASECSDADSGMCFIDDLEALADAGFDEEDLASLEDAMGAYPELRDVIEVGAPGGDALIIAYQALPEVVADIQGRRRPETEFSGRSENYRQGLRLLCGKSALECDEREWDAHAAEVAAAIGAIDAGVGDGAAFIVESAFVDAGHKESAPSYHLLAAGEADSDFLSVGDMLEAADLKNGVDVGCDPTGANLVIVAHGQGYAIPSEGRASAHFVERVFVLHQLDDVRAWKVTDGAEEPERYSERPELLAQDFRDAHLLQRSDEIVGKVYAAMGQVRADRCAPDVAADLAAAREAARAVGDELEALKQEVIDYANERTNGAFSDAMTYDKAIQCIDVPGWGVPEDVRETVERIDELSGRQERAQQGKGERGL